MLVKNKTNLLLVNVQEVQLLDNSIPFTVVPSYCYVITPCHHFDVSIWSKSHVLIGYWSKKDLSCLLKIAYFYPAQEKNYILDGQDPYFFSSMWAKEWPKWAEDSQNKRNTNNSPCYIVLFPSSPKKQSFLTLNKAKPLCFTINPLWTKSIWWLDISLVFFCFLRTKVKSRSIKRE